MTDARPSPPEQTAEAGRGGAPRSPGRLLRRTGTAIRHLAALVFGLTAGTSLAALCRPSPAAYAALIAALALLGDAALWAAQLLLLRLLDRPLEGFTSLLALLGPVTYAVKKGMGEGLTWRVWLLSAALTALAALTAALLWAVTVRRRASVPSVLAALLCAAVSVLAVLLLVWDGPEDSYISDFLSAAPARETALAPALPLEDGPCEVLTLDYGPGEEIDPGTADLSAFMERDLGTLSGLCAELRADYALTEVPLRGRIWYPAGGQACPTLLIVHGNHELSAASYLGYGYLGAYLASWGYAVISVDENACNLLKNENDGRAVLLLENLGAALALSEKEDGPLSGVLDAENIALAGHSRGGEAVAEAYLFNRLDAYPENGAVTFDYGFGIRSLIAIAPTADQYRPADRAVELTDVNYLLLHGAADRDVTQPMGMAQYAAVSFTGGEDCLKSALYIGGANHGQFNTLWGRNDVSGPGAVFTDTASLLSGEEQRTVARVFLKVFLDVTLRGDDTCRDLLTDWERFASQLPETVYAQCWERAGFTALADFEEDADVTSGSAPGTRLRAVGTSLWREERLSFGSDGGTHAARLRWSGSASFSLSFPAADLTGLAVAFDICDRDTDAVRRGSRAPLDADVILTDADGNRAAARLSDFATVFPVQPVKTDKADYLFGTCSYRYFPSTVSIPAEAFEPEGRSFDPSRVAELTFRFTGGGSVDLDNIGWYGA